MTYTTNSQFSTLEDHMSELSIYLKKQIRDRDWTWRVAEETTGVSKSALANIIDNPDVTPSLETLVKLSRAFKLPLWRVVEMAGFDLELSRGDTPQAQRLASLMEAMPQYRPVVEYLMQIDSDDLEGMLVYLETLQRRRAAEQ
jgi:transcriptional regulator with XRE-family HTH domain